jgi:hypothetical protein
MWAEAFAMASSARVHPFPPHISLRIAAPVSRPWRQFGTRSIERLRLAEGEVASMFDVPFMRAWNGTSFDAKQR